MILCMGWIWLVSYIIVLGILCAIKYKNYTYFAEITAIFEILIYLIMVLCC
jgi:uncharacterized protein YebE (UPF0316 family)